MIKEPARGQERDGSAPHDREEAERRPEPRIVEERDNYLLVCDGGRYAVVERRRGLYYPMHGDGRREGVPLDRLRAALPAADWSDLATAARVLEDVTNRREDLAENIW